MEWCAHFSISSTDYCNHFSLKRQKCLDHDWTPSHCGICSMNHTITMTVMYPNYFNESTWFWRMPTSVCCTQATTHDSTAKLSIDYLQWWRCMDIYVLLLQSRSPHEAVKLQEKKRNCIWREHRKPISTTTQTGLTPYWRIYDHVLITMLDAKANSTSTWHLAASATTLILEMGCTKHCKGEWKNSDFSSSTAYVKDKMLKCAIVYAGVAYSNCDVLRENGYPKFWVILVQCPSP